MNACGDYKQYMNNPDALVNWDLIEQVVSAVFLRFCTQNVECVMLD